MCPKKNERLDRDYYYHDKAKFYSNSQWMAKNQIQTAHRALELLEDDKIGGELDLCQTNLIILDLGCGSGFSSYVCENNGFKVVGLDLSMDMLYENIQQQKIIEDNKNNIKNARILINASIEHLPIRNHTVDIMISISAFNFVIRESESHFEKEKILSRISTDLRRVLKEGGRILIEFYPKRKDIALYLKVFKKNYIGGLIIDNPGLRKEKKFLILKSAD